MDTRIPIPLNARKLIISPKEKFEITLKVIKCLAEMEIGVPILVGNPDMYKFIYNINRIRRNTLPNEFKYLSKGRKYLTLTLPELELLLIIRVK